MKKAWDLLLSAFLTLIVISLLTFILMKFVPGGPFDGDKALPPEVTASLEAKFGLDRPAPEQYFRYLQNIFFHADFGPSIKYIGRSVQEIIAESLPVSLELGAYALILSIVLGILLGTIAAVYRGRFWDTGSMLLAISGVSLPSFLVATLVIWIFGQKLDWFPVALWDSPAHKVLPSLVLGIRPAAIIARMTRSAVLETLHFDFVRTARAKGLSEAKVLFVHVLKNALIPIITVIGPIAATVLTGSFVVEYVFAIPGLASHFIDAVTNRDYPLIMGVTLLFAAFLVVINLIVDILYVWIDPRIGKTS